MGLIAGVLRDDTGAPVVGGSVNIYTIDTTTPVTLYSDRGLTVTRANPITTGSAGEYAAYAPDSIYDHHITASGHADVDIPDVPCTDPRNYVLLAGRAGGQTINLDTASGAATGKISSTAHATKGRWFLNAAGTITVDEANVRFGVGVAAPSHPLDVRTTGTGVAARIQSTHASGYSGVEYYDEAGTPKLFIGADLTNDKSLINATYPLQVMTNSVERLSISAAGVAVWNDTGADNDLRMEGDTDQNLFFLDASADQIAFGHSAPSEKVDIRTSTTQCNLRLESSSTSAAQVSAKFKRNTTGNVREWNAGVGILGSTEFCIYDVTGSRAVVTLDANGNWLSPAMHNATGNTATTAMVTSGTYTPTMTAVANCVVSSAVCQWMRVGNVVTVSGRVTCDPVAAASTFTEFGVSLPVASDFTALGQLAGAAVYETGTNQILLVVADTTNNRADMSFPAGNTDNRALYFTFTYVVV